MAGTITLIISSGKNNQISDNKFYNTGGITFYSFKNLKICSNEFYSLSIYSSAFVTIGENENTQLIANKVYYMRLLLINKGSYMDKQINNGNTWDCPGVSCWIPFYIVNADPLFVDLSPITVHTKQSITVNPSGPGFYTPYFPTQIDPVPNGSWWKTDVSGKPKTQSACLDKFTGEDDSEVFRQVANGSISNIITNSIQLAQVQRTLFFELKNNPSLLDKNASFKSFFENKSKTNLSNLYEIWNGIQLAKSASDTELKEVKSLTSKLNGKIDELRKLDNLLQSDIDQETINTINKQKEATNSDLLESLQALEKIKANIKLETANKASKLIGANKEFTPVNVGEANEQIVNHYSIKLLMGEILEDQELNELEKIARECPRTGGYSVFTARQMLPNCRTKDIDDFKGDCYPKVEGGNNPNEVPILSKVQKDKTNNSDISLYPNPASESISVFSANAEKGQIVITNLMGTIVLKQNFYTGEAISISNLSNGVYWAKISVNGEDTLKKVVISK